MRQLLAVGRQQPHKQSLPVWQSLNPLLLRAGSIAPPPGPPRRAEAAEAEQRPEGAETVVSKPRVLYPGCPTLVLLSGVLPRRTAAVRRTGWPRGRLVAR